MNHDIRIAIDHADWLRVLPGAEAVCRAAAAASLAAGAPDDRSLELSLLLASDDFVAGLNRDYRDRQGATNVLSFATGAAVGAPPAAGQPALLGDVVVALETASREAEEAGCPLADHLSHLVVHGTLHLFGFDHEVAADAARMEAVEVAVLAGLGIADPYEAAENAPA